MPIVLLLALDSDACLRLIFGSVQDATQVMCLFVNMSFWRWNNTARVPGCITVSEASLLRISFRLGTSLVDHRTWSDVPYRQSGTKSMRYWQLWYCSPLKWWHLWFGPSLPSSLRDKAWNVWRAMWRELRLLRSTLLASIGSQPPSFICIFHHVTQKQIRNILITAGDFSAV